ncbi:VanW family protein [Corynebacterium sp.]|uniref:VanW family protein n=1 Tax=Corynebacterium sp. TaxID=1720 RepID=UPI0026DB4908|nr:VanW family protein [Corynebacterium sp.]MDO5076747.1 VanW family protein [Corynebacterium sp.]
MRASKTSLIVLGLLIGLFALSILAYGVDFFLSRGTVPRGTTVAGVAIGGLSPSEAEKRLQTAKTPTKVEITANDMKATFAPAEAGLAPDWKATVAAAGTRGLNPFPITQEVPVVSKVDEAKFKVTADRLVHELSREPVDGAVALEAGNVKVTDPIIGQKTTVDMLKVIQEDWVNPAGVKVKVPTTDPAITADIVEKVAEGEAKTAVSGPITLHGRDAEGVIPPERMGEVVTFVPDGKHLRGDVNGEVARNILSEGIGKSEKPKKNAKITPSGVEPHEDGVRVDWDLALKDLDKRILAREDREFDAVYIDEPATFTTAQAESATFDEVVGEFTTGGFSAASGVNIRRTAEIVNGAVVAPGDVFSLNEWTGPRGTAQGFVESGIILNGRADTAVGGGISQFATTLYNASYFAGMEDVAHTPHSYYISRYPAGREATVFEGAIDLKFRNTSPHPVLIRASADSSNVTVRLMGVKTVNVESVPGGRWAQTSPHTVTVSGPKCSASEGAPGFTTSDTRIVRDLNGAEISRETTTTKYDPSPIVKCQ